MKIFISTPFAEKTECQIMASITTARHIIWERFGEEVECIDNYSYEQQTFNGIDCMLNAISQISECDAVAFTYDWEKSEGCKIEMAVAKKYGYPVILLP